jgi:hypothetical protein
VRTLSTTPDGAVWVGTEAGVLRYARGRTETVAAVPRNWVLAAFPDPDGSVWFGHGWGGGGAVNVRRLEDGRYVTQTVSAAQGLTSDTVYSILVETNGTKWFGTGEGLFRFDGVRWTNFNATALGSNRVWSILRDRRGILWLGTQGGLFRYDGQELSRCALPRSDPREKSPLEDHIWCLHEARDGRLWLGTANLGAAVYDGTACSSLDARDGLGDSSVLSICEGADGTLWFATRRAGVASYHPVTHKPRLRLESAAIGGRPVPDPARLPPVAIGQGLNLRYGLTDMLSLPAKHNYRAALTRREGGAAARTLFQDYSTEGRRDLTLETKGDYELVIEAVDRDLNYSDPIRLRFAVYVPWYLNRLRVVPGAAGLAVLLAWLGLLDRQKRQQRKIARQLRERMLEQERQARLSLEEKNLELEQRQLQLQEALANIKTLRGLIPICSYCKKIRNDKGFWERVETYIKKHSEANFSHGICPACMKEHFPQFMKDMPGEGSAREK